MDTKKETLFCAILRMKASIITPSFDPHERRKKAVDMALELGGLAAFFFFIFEILATISS